MKILKFCSLIWLMMMTTHAWSQSISIDVDQNRVAVGEPLSVTYTLQGDVNDFKLPPFKGFTVYESGQSTNVSIINGKISKSISYNVTLVPMKMGNYTIPGATAIINGRRVNSSSFSVQVEKGSDVTRNSTSNSNHSAPQNVDAPSDDWKDDIVLLADADKKKAFVGEQITITYKLLRRLDYQTMEVEKLPVFKGFLSEEMEIPDQKSEGIMEYKGKKYYYQAFRKVALFGSQAGVQTIDPLTVRGVILLPDKDPFFGTTIFSTTSPKEVRILSNTLKIEVDPLPLQNKPANFSGAVGEYSISRQLESSKVIQGQATVLSYQVSGWGNLKAITALPQQMDPSVEVFDPEIKDSPQKNGEIYGGSRTFNYSLVPQNSGTVIIPPYDFVYFNPQKQTYITEKLPQMTIDVAAGHLNVEAPSANGKNFDTQLKSNWGNSASNELIPIAIAFASGITLLAFTGFLIWRNKRISKFESKQDSVEWPNLAAYPEERRYSILAETFRDKLKNKLQVKGNSDEDILRNLSDDYLKKKVAYILISCDRASYSPLKAESVENLQKQVEEVFLSINKSSHS